MDRYVNMACHNHDITTAQHVTAGDGHIPEES